MFVFESIYFVMVGLIQLQNLLYCSQYCVNLLSLFQSVPQFKINQFRDTVYLGGIRVSPKTYCCLTEEVI